MFSAMVTDSAEAGSPASADASGSVAAAANRALALATVSF
jgi:hypothetical protein